MKDTVYEKEEEFYELFLKKAIGYSNGEVEGIQFKQIVAAAGVVAKQKQTRGAMDALKYQVARDKEKGLVPRQFQIEHK